MQLELYNPKLDKEQLLQLSDRLTDFSLPERIKQKDFRKLQYDFLKQDLEETQPIILVIKEQTDVAGFLHLQTETDWLTGEKQGYISRIVVAEVFEGKGFGKKLMAAAETWARENNYATLGLNVFAANKKALRFYHQLGYESETIKMVKTIW